MPMPFYGNGFELSVFCVFNIPMYVRACVHVRAIVSLYYVKDHLKLKKNAIHLKLYTIGLVGCLLEFLLELSVTLGNASIRSTEIPFSERFVILVM